MKSHSSNPCAGAFADWLDVMLLKECNGHCSWCIEKNGYHPDDNVPVEELISTIIKTGKKNIVLLGGEPTLYKDLGKLIWGLSEAKLNVYLTTNGSKLTEKFAAKNRLDKLKGLNVSIHHYSRDENKKITGVKLNYDILADAITYLYINGVDIRLNCNCFKGGIDNYAQVISYLNFAKSLGVKTVRFAEITGNDDIFVKLNDIFTKENLPNCPFEFGCNHARKINNVNVIFRQMCGLKTSGRERPENPEQKYTKNNVMYYDGKCYDGWLTKTYQKGESKMSKLIREVVNSLVDGNISKEIAIEILEKLINTTVPKSTSNHNHTRKKCEVGDESCHGRGGGHC